MTQGPHAVMIPFPAQGHINPMMHLACRLSAFGFTITFVNTHSNHIRILDTWKQRGIAIPQEQGIDINLISLADDSLPPIDMESVFKVMIVTDRLKAAFQEVIQNISTSVTCIISDGFLPWTEDVARSYGVPWAVFWAPSTATGLVSLYIPDLISKGYAPLKASNEQTPIDFIPGLPEILPADLPASILNEDSCDIGFRHRIERAERLKRADWIFANTFEELEEDEGRAMQREVENSYLSVGPTLPLNFLAISDWGKDVEMATGVWSEDEKCMEWLDGKETASVLYVSFGNIANVSSEQVEQIALGLEGCEHPFLWVIRPDLVKQLSEKKNVRGRGLIISWAPQLRVLRHSAVGGFLTHCGWNSTMEGICSGIPMLAWPCFADQNLNCHYIVKEWKIGLDFKRGSDGIVSKGEIVRVVRALMKGVEGMRIRKRLGEFKMKARNAVRRGGSSYQNLQEFAEAMRNRSSTLMMHSSGRGTSSSIEAPARVRTTPPPPHAASVRTSPPAAAQRDHHWRQNSGDDDIDASRRSPQSVRDVSPVSSRGNDSVGSPRDSEEASYPFF